MVLLTYNTCVLSCVGSTCQKMQNGGVCLDSFGKLGQGQVAILVFVHPHEDFSGFFLCRQTGLVPAFHFVYGLK